MGYGKDIYDCVIKKLENQKREAINAAQKRKQQLYNKCPRVQEIELTLSSTAARVAKAVLSGANTKERLNFLKEHNLNLQKELLDILKKYNLPLNYLEITYKCNKCNDEGYIDGRMCKCMKLMLRQEAYDRLNSLSPLSLSSFDNFSLEYYEEAPSNNIRISSKKRMGDILDYCKNYSSKFDLKSKSLLMQGASGLGKTHLSLAVAKEVIDRGYGVIYGSTPNIMSKLEKERFRYSRNIDEIETENLLIDCDLLILDDLGTEYSTQFSSATLYNIINFRIISNKPTIINTNLSLKELEKNYSERLVSRIIGEMIRLEFLGKDIRHQKTMQKLRKS